MMTKGKQPLANAELVTLREAARRTGLGLRQFYRARDQGELTVVEIGGWTRIRWVDVLAWVARHERLRPDSTESR
jgi:excisionase family DNA binding protein